jgi:hypothetical protein
MGKRGNIIDKEGIKKFIANNGLDDMVVLDKKDKLLWKLVLILL